MRPCSNRRINNEGRDCPHDAVRFWLRCWCYYCLQRWWASAERVSISKLLARLLAIVAGLFMTVVSSMWLKGTAKPPASASASMGLLSRWRSSGKSRSIEGGGSSRGMHGKRTPSTTMDFTGGLPFNDEDDSELDLLPTSQRPQKHHLAQVSRPTDQSYTQMRRQRFQVWFSAMLITSPGKPTVWTTYMDQVGFRSMR